MYVLFISLNLGEVRHHTDFVSSDLCRKVALKFGMKLATVCMGPSYTFPQISGLVWFAFTRVATLFFFIHINISLAQVEISFIIGINNFNFKKSSVFSLVPETLLIVSKNGLAL